MPENIELSRRRVLGGLAATGLASAAAGAGTMAAFSDSESSTGNTVQSGTLDLTLDGGNSTVTFLDVGGAVPGDNGDGTVTLANAGSVSASPAVDIAAIDATDRSGTGSGQLLDHLAVAGTLGGTTVFTRQPASQLSAGTTYSAGPALAGGESRVFTLEWWLPQDTPNSAQGDSVSLDLTFRLTQEGV